MGDERSHGSWVRYGVAAHRSCLQLLQERLDYNFRFEDVWPLLQQRWKHTGSGQFATVFHDPSDEHDYSTNHLDCSYGGISKYYGTAWVGVRECSCFAFCSVSPEDEYMLLDPLQCSSNADRIVQVWEPLVQQFEQAEGDAGYPKVAAGSDSDSVSAPGANVGSAAQVAEGCNQLQAGRVARRLAAQTVFASTQVRVNY
jgi:hypothetical protein